MNEILTFSTDEVRPARPAVLENQGIGPGRNVPAKIERLCANALDLLCEVAAPIGVVSEIAKADFELVYAGQGLNEPETPVADVFPRAERLALFAVTLGAAVGWAIDARFKAGDLALGAMLDSAASAAADRLAAAVQQCYARSLAQAGGGGDHMHVLRYSPGYCGWHIGGQRNLFEVLRPERVGITLRQSCLMEPLKSVSGVVIAGPPGTHEFDMSYGFCAPCESRTCLERRRVGPTD